MLGCSSAPQPVNPEPETAVTDVQTGSETLTTDVAPPTDVTPAKDASAACASLSCDDDNTCTYDDCGDNGACTHTSVSDGNTCLDANKCFIGATCQAGNCVTGNTPVVCDKGKDCQTATCNPASGCAYKSLPVGTPCDDVDGCTTGDICFADGSCTGQPVVCTGGVVCKAGKCGATGTGTGCEFSASPMTGEAGAPCAQDADCDSNLCVDTANGKVCTISCASCCPNGWQCEYTASGPTFACVPYHIHSCEPCTTDAKCQSPNDPGGLCVSYGDAGSFCGGSCEYDADCAVGYLCQKSKAGIGSQCVKQNGLCVCSAFSVAQGLTTECAVSNTFGTCTAGRQCTASGLTACSAKTPSAEVCNGVDDDCDGTVDEAGAAGCTGTPCLCP